MKIELHTTAPVEAILAVVVTVVGAFVVGATSLFISGVARRSCRNQSRSSPMIFN